MIDIIIAAVIVAVVSVATVYIRKSKKKGIQCIGCADAPHCAAKGQCQSCKGDCKTEI